MQKKPLNKLVQAAIIAALYAALTLAFAPLSYNVMQVRFSEALTVLSMYTSAAIPGLTVGCLIANLLGPNGIWDVVLGTLATFIGVAGMYFFRKKKYFAPMINVIVNGLIIGLMLRFIYGVPVSAPLCVFWVALGELISCYALGIPLIKLLDKRAKDIGLADPDEVRP